MIRKMLVLAMTFTLTLSTAHAGGATTLKSVFDNFSYTSAVENDRQGAVEGLKAGIAALQAEGVSNKEILNYAVSQVKDQQLQSEFRSTLAMVDAGKLTASQANDMVRDIVSKSHAQGSSWSGAGNVLLIVGLVALVVVAAVLGGCNSEVYDCRYDSNGNDYSDTTYDTWYYPGGYWY